MLGNVVRNAAAEFGDQPALFHRDEWSISYNELDQVSDEVAVWLSREVGAGVGTVIGLALPSSLEYLVCYAAASKLGAISAGVNPQLTAPERKHVLSTLTPDVLITDESTTGVDGTDATVIRLELATSVEDVAGAIRPRGESFQPVDDEPLRPVAICFTSGSTGEPKGAVFRNAELAAVARIDGAGAGFSAAGHTILGTALAHVGVMAKLPWMLACGVTLHVLPKWSATDVLRLTEKYRMSGLNGGAAHAALLLRHPDLDKYDLSSVRTIIAGSAASTPAQIQEARRRIGGVYSVRYSLTESGGVGLATAPDADDDELFHTVGRPRAGVAARIVIDGADAPDGEPGELWLRADSVMHEYWRDPAATAETLVGGWLRTGDIASRDALGRYRIVGRAKEMFVRGGYNVYPLEIEAQLASHPKVAQVAVVPRPDPVMGEIGVAVVVPRQPQAPPTLDELRMHCEDRLARYKLPEAMRLVDHLPMTAAEKLDRRGLAAYEAASTEGNVA